MRERDFRESVVSEVSLVCIDILEKGRVRGFPLLSWNGET